MSLLKKKYRVAIVLLFAGLACGSVRAQDTPIADVATGYSLIVVGSETRKKENSRSGIRYRGSPWAGKVLCVCMGKVNEDGEVATPRCTERP
jgi:hypothetical protein